MAVESPPNDITATFVPGATFTEKLDESASGYLKAQVENKIDKSFAWAEWDTTGFAAAYELVATDCAGESGLGGGPR